MPDAYSLQNYNTLDIETDDGTAVPIAGVTDATITPTVELEKLFSADSIKRASALQHSFEVPIELTINQWNVTIAREWLGGGDGGESGTMADTSNPQRFSMTAEFDSEGGERTLGPLTVERIVFEEMPIFDGSMQEYNTWEYSGDGADIVDVDTVDNTV